MVQIESATEILPLLVDELKSEDIFARRTALQGLSLLGPAAKEALPFLLDSLEDRDENVRHGAANVLGSLGIHAINAIGPLTEALESPKPNGSAAEALSRIAVAAQDQGATQVVRELEAALKRLSIMKDFKGQAEIVRRAVDDLNRAVSCCK